MLICQVYLSGTALVIFDRPNRLLQTIYHDDNGDGDFLDAVVLDQQTGKIAVSSKHDVHIYWPLGQDEGLLKWSLQYTLQGGSGARSECTLSWGLPNELLVGSSELRLFQTDNQARQIWTQELSSPVAIATQSPDGTLIASTADPDVLVKLWRRLAFDTDEVEYEHCYLVHPAVVTGLQWRQRLDSDRSSSNVLYSISADLVVRVWADSNGHQLHYLQLRTLINLHDPAPRAGLDTTGTNDHFVIFLRDSDFVKGVSAANKTDRLPFYDHLAEVASHTPDVCVVIDDQGRLNAWGIPDALQSQTQGNEAFIITHIGRNIFGNSRPECFEEATRQMIGLIDPGSSDFLLLPQSNDSNLSWYEAGLASTLDPMSKSSALKKQATWTGHDAPITKMIRTRGGRAMVSRTASSQALVWRQAVNLQDPGLSLCSKITSPETVHRTAVLGGGRFVATLYSKSISLWDARGREALQICSSPYTIEGRPLCLILLPAVAQAPSRKFVATVSSMMQGIVWEIDIPGYATVNGDMTDLQTATLREFTRFDLGLDRSLLYVLPVDPAGSKPVATDFLDAFAKDVALSYDETGDLTTWAARVDAAQGTVEWLATATVRTGIQSPSLASASAIRKVALVDSKQTGLSIWDTRNAQLEIERSFGPVDTIQDLDWTSTPDEQSLLAVGFPHRVVIVAQIRYDYLEKCEAWAPIREISIRDFTPHPIGDSTWLGSGDFVIGAGNQLFVYGRNAHSSDDSVRELSSLAKQRQSLDLFSIVSVLNGPLPCFHPQFLMQCILAGQSALVAKVIISLNQALKFFTEGESLEHLLPKPWEEIMGESKTRPGHAQRTSSFFGDAASREAGEVTEEIAASLNEQLTQKTLPYLSSREQLHLADLVECVALAEKHRRSVDENAVRFYLFFRRHMWSKERKVDPSPDVSWREIAWAFHSGSQDILLNLVTRQFNGRLLWQDAKESGICMWITDVNVLRTQFEIVARNEYTKTDEKNPVDCSLFYLALRKKNVLLGLWRMAGWNREQASTMRLLANDFSDPRWQTAALKNAYALLGKRRFEYAAAFFLLAGKLRDAVNVCLNQMQDLQLAIAVARVYDGDESPVLQELLEQNVLPLAGHDGNRWMAMWAFWMLGRRDMAVRALITPVHVLIDAPTVPSPEARSFRATDPALVVLYQQLREKTLQGLIGASQVSPRDEWEFLLQIARIYDRMGCDALALGLVRNWEFLRPTTARPQQNVSDPRQLLRRRSSLIVDDLPPASPLAVRSPSSLRSPGLKAPPPKVFEEPEANSLLDSFGF